MQVAAVLYVYQFSFIGDPDTKDQTQTRSYQQPDAYAVRSLSVQFNATMAPFTHGRHKSRNLPLRVYL